MNDKKRVIGVIRLSTAEQAAEGEGGIDRQHTDIDTAARIHNLEVVRRVKVIESGTKVRGQADFERVFRELKSGDIDGDAVSNLDRLVRPDRFEDFAVFDHFRLNRKCIWTPGEVVDPATQNGFLVSGFRGLLAGIERQLILARTAAGKEEARKRGRHPGGAKLLPRAVAYDRESDKWSYVEPHASRMRVAYELLFEDKSFYSIAAQIGGWTAAGIKKALMNPLWKGVRRSPPSGDRRVPLDVRVFAEADALISGENGRRLRSSLPDETKTGR